MLPVHCPVPTSAVGQPVIQQHPATQVSQEEGGRSCALQSVVGFCLEAVIVSIKVLFPPGCWCPEGQVMNHMQQCVLPEECVCEVAGVHYWPGQQIKVNCEICVCERGRPQRCQPNPDCAGKSFYHFTNTELIFIYIFGVVLHLSIPTHPLLSHCSTLWLVIVV